MKKLIICLATLALAGTISAVASDNKTTASDNNCEISVTAIPESCKSVGNVTASIDEKGNIEFTNYNSFAVNVSWQAVGYTESGQEVRAGSGTVYLQEHGAKYSADQATRKAASGLKYYNIDFQVYQC